MHRRRRGHRRGAGDVLTAGLLPAGHEALLFAGAVLALNATPGVDLLLTASTTATRGLRAGLAAAAGICTGAVVHTLAAAFGLAALLALVPAAFRVLQWAGAAYLLWLGIGLLRAAWAQPAAAAVQPAADTRMGDFLRGMLTNVLNPKVALFFLAFLPQFVPAASPSKTASFVLLGGWFVLQSMLFLTAFAGLVGVVSRRGRWQTSGRAGRWMRSAGGLLFVALALRLLRERPAAA